MSSHVEKIKEKLPVHEVVGSYIELQKAGSNYKGKCPFHNEKTPSFFVSPNRDSYYCFGCGESGDIFTFVEKFEGLDFRGALKVLAEKSGVEISFESSGKKDKREKLFEIMEIATIFYQQNLKGKDDVEKYIHERGVSNESISKWRIGYANNEWRTLYEFLKKKGITEELMFEAGLIKKGGENKYYDTFRDRVMFPIFDSSGRVVAFSGRIFSGGTDAAKYINSPETPLFVKSEILYGLNFAKNEIRKKNYSVLVEGQFDLILSHQSGVENSVATSGTAFTHEHLDRLKKMSSRVIFAFDTDQAGFNATLKAGELALKMGMEVKVGDLPEGSDPADIVHGSVDVWKDSLRKSTHLIEFYLEKILKEGITGRNLGKTVSQKILPYVALIESEIEKEYFINLIADKIKSKKESVWEDLKHITRTDVLIDDEIRKVLKIEPEHVTSVERRLFGILYWFSHSKGKEDKSKELEETLRGVIGNEKFETFTTLLVNEKEKLGFEIESYYGAEIAEKEIQDLLRALTLNVLKKEFAQAMKNLENAEREHRKEEIPDFLKKCQEISVKIQKLKDS